MRKYIYGDEEVKREYDRDDDDLDVDDAKGCFYIKVKSYPENLFSALFTKKEMCCLVEMEKK